MVSRGAGLVSFPRLGSGCSNLVHKELWSCFLQKRVWSGHADGLVDLSLGPGPVRGREGKTVTQRLRGNQEPCHSAVLYKIDVFAWSLT